MKAAYCIAILYLDMAVSAIPTFYGSNNLLIDRPIGKQEAWPCKDMKSTGWNKIALTKPNSEAVINSMFKIVKPPCNHHHSIKDVKVPDMTQKPDEGPITPKNKGALKNLARRNVTIKQSEPGKTLMAAATHNKPTILGNQVREEDRKVGAFTNIVNSKIAMPRLAHVLRIPQRKYFNVRRDENLILRNQKSNSLQKDRQLRSNLQFTVLHGPKDFFNGDTFNIDEIPASTAWNKLPVISEAVAIQPSEKIKRHTPGKETTKKFIMTKKDLHNGVIFRDDRDGIPYALFYRIPKKNDSKSNDLLKYLSEPSATIYGPYVAMLHSVGGDHANRKRMNKVKDIYVQ